MIRPVLVAVVAVSLGIADASLGREYYSHSGLQGARSSLPERLGYPADAKLLIVHADDLGMAHSVDAATIKPSRVGWSARAALWFPVPGCQR